MNVLHNQHLPTLLFDTLGVGPSCTLGASFGKFLVRLMQTHCPSSCNPLQQSDATKMVGAGQNLIFCLVDLPAVLSRGWHRASLLIEPTDGEEVNMYWSFSRMSSSDHVSELAIRI